MRQICLILLFLPLLLTAQSSLENGTKEVERLVKMGDFEKAFNLRESIYKQFSKSNTNDYQQLSKDLIELATLGFEAAQYQKAIAYAEQVIAFYDEKKIENNIFATQAHQIIGSCYINLEDYKKSVWHTNMALDIANNASSKNYVLITKCHIVLGQNHSDLEEFDKSLFHYDSAKSIIIEHLSGREDLLAEIHYSMGWFYEEQKKYELAGKYFGQAADSKAKIFGNIHPETALSRHLVVRMAMEARAYGAIDSLAKKCFESANFDPEHLEIANDLSISVFRTIRNVMIKDINQYHITKDTNYLNHGLMTYELGKAIPQRGNKKFFREKDKRDWSGLATLFYKLGATLTLEKGNNDYKNTVFELLEKCKASLLRNGISDNLSGEIPNISKDYMTKEKNLRDEINYWEKEYKLNNKENVQEQSKRINQELLRIYTSYDSLIAQIEIKNKDYYDIKYNENTVKVSEIQELLDENQALISYSVVSDSSLMICVINKKEFEIKQIPLHISLKKEVAKLGEALKNLYPTNSKFEKAAEDYTKSAKLLYDMLIAPIAAKLPQSLVIIPDEELNYVPFESLLSVQPTKLGNFKNYPFLLQNHEISYNYSATLWKELQLRKKKTNIEQSNFIAFAPDFNKNPTNTYTTRIAEPKLTPLKYNQAEANEIANLLNGKKIVGADASISNFVKMIPNYKIIHICTHGKADNTDGDISYLAFQTVTDSTKNALLYVKDIYKLSINCDLVTMSACETGIGSLQRGEGFISLSRAFTMIGARSLLATLWSIDDETSKNIMVDFYKNLKSGTTKSKSLRAAKLNYINQISRENTFYASPFYWAAFIPIGNMEKIF